jgi:hypothetical protein
MIVLENFWRRIAGNKFRAFVHPPQRLGAVLQAAGFVRDARRETLVWALDLYRRGSAI